VSFLLEKQRLYGGRLGAVGRSLCLSDGVSCIAPPAGELSEDGVEVGCRVCNLQQRRAWKTCA
jgi:hypothetical protein